MKTISLFSFFALLFTVISCKKKTDPEPNVSHFEGNFLCDVDFNYYYNGGNSVDYDKVVRCYVENDSLKVSNHAFPIQSEDQTVFLKTNSITNGYVRVTFSNNYNSILIEVDSPSYLSGPESGSISTGMRTSLPETTTPHPCLDELEGIYDLDIYYRSDADSIDTQFVSSTMITMPSSYIFIDSYQFYTSFTFHSYYDQTVSSTSNSGTFYHTRSVQWHNNSINLDYRTVQSYPWFQPNDTTHHIISGTK
ncbi:MAG: hypothetical protein AB8B56_02770 [Crocinitomicaceae bacterium]